MLNFATVIKCWIMDIALNSTNNYWNLLKHLSSDVKLELISRLSRSLQNDKADSTIARGITSLLLLSMVYGKIRTSPWMQTAWCQR